MTMSSDSHPRLVFLFDGHCRLCANGARIMKRLARPGELALVDFQGPGALFPFPQVTYDDCMKEAQLVDGKGRRAFALPRAT